MKEKVQFKWNKIFIKFIYWFIKKKLLINIIKYIIIQILNISIKITISF